MSFEKEMRRFMTTSFPSKILDYCRYGKPLFFWGPEYSTAVQFARSQNLGPAVCDPDPAACVLQIERYALDKTAQRVSATKAMELSRTIFDPHRIHAQLVREITNLTRLNGCETK